jgi:hypothetical protein
MMITPMIDDTIAPELAARIERLIGAPIEGYRMARGGYSLATRLVCHSGRASFFVKIGTTPGTSAALRREISVYQRVQGDFMPRAYAWDDQDHAPILVTEDLSAYAWPPPWNAQGVELVLAQIEALHHSAATLEPFAEVHPDWQATWPAIAADPAPFLSLGIASPGWLEAALPALIAAEAQCSSAGQALCHWDLRSDNICIAPGRAIFVDWNHACLSNPQLDLGFLLPSLAYEGGPPPERVLPGAPEVAAWVAGYFAARAGLPPVAEAPTVRVVQRQQLETALPWAARALGLPLPA